MKLEFHPAVQEDFIQARDYYQTKRWPAFGGLVSSENSRHACRLFNEHQVGSRFTSVVKFSDVSDSGIFPI